MTDRPDWRVGREIREHEIKTDLQRKGVPEREAAKLARDVAEKAVRRAIHDHDKKGS